MKRRVMQILFAVGLLLTLAAGTLWVRSYWKSDRLGVGASWIRAQDREYASVSITTGPGIACINWARNSRYEPGWTWLPIGLHASHSTSGIMQPRLVGPRAAGSAIRWWERLGFAGWSGNRGTSLFYLHYPGIIVPGWFLPLVFAAPTAALGARLWTVRRRERARRAHGLCLACGYDLRGAAHERCPECGAIIETAGRTDRGLPPAAGSSRTADRAGASS